MYKDQNVEEKEDNHVKHKGKEKRKRLCSVKSMHARKKALSPRPLSSLFRVLQAELTLNNTLVRRGNVRRTSNGSVAPVNSHMCELQQKITSCEKKSKSMMALLFYLNR